MKRALVIGVVVVAFASIAGAQGTVVGSEHDLSSNLPSSQRVCVFCHTPHQPEGPPKITVDPLWNHTLSSIGSYGVYSSVTFDGAATIADIGGGTTASNLCMSCHDGTVGIGSLYNEPNIPGGGEETPTNVGDLMTGNALMGIDLSNDHPVNFIYDTALASADGGLVDPAGSPLVQGLLFGGTVQCASCHDPHDPTNYPFLVLDNTASALCLTCHNK
jgi:predicted CXXCH cytochrome family protein